jgi:hypothetical protein
LATFDAFAYTLVPVDRDHTGIHQPGLATEHQHFTEQLRERRLKNSAIVE